MPEDQDTAASQAAETETSTVNGTPVEESTTGPVAQEAQDKVDKAEYEKVQKELNKVNQELNLRRNREKEIERETLEKAGDLQGVNETLKREIAELQAQREADELKSLTESVRSKVLSEFSAQTQKLARDLNITWDGELTADEAGVQLRNKLTALESTIGGAKDTQGSPTVHANNPQTVDDVSFDPHTAPLAELEKLLPKADPR